jgi:hypothetical protein
MKRLCIIFLMVLSFSSIHGQQKLDSLKEGFVNPPSHVRPQIWWHWMNGNITKDGIRKDIEWFDRIGLGGFHVFDAIFSTPQVVEERLVYMEEPWQDAFKYAIDLADSLGLDVTIPSSPGFSSTGGPWVKPEEAMKKIVWREITVEGGRKIRTELPDPYTNTGKFQNYGMKKGPSVVDSGQVVGESYSDIAVIAVRLPDDYRTLEELGATVTSSGGSFTLEQLTNGDLSDSSKLPAGKEGYSWIQYSFPEPQTIRSLAVINDIVRNERHSLPAHCEDSLQISNDGIHFTTAFGIPVGDALRQTISFHPITAKHFRLKHRNPVSAYHYTMKERLPDPEYSEIAEFVIYPETRINHVEEKAGFGSAHDIELNPTPNADDVISHQVVDLTDMVRNGRLSWKAPEGRWRIYRLGASLTGKLNHPASPEATGLEVDKLDKEAWVRHFRNYIDMNKAAVKGRLGQEGISYMLVDSYEAAHQNWTPRLREEFTQRRGYDPILWYPVLTGQILHSPDQSERFLWDWRKTIGELFEENFAILDKLVKEEYGMKGCYVESHGNGRAFIADGMSMKSHCDLPMSEIWVQGKVGTQNRVQEGISDIRESSSVAHIYGKEVVAAESFTATGAGGEAYRFHPANIKWTADTEISNGLNHFVIHDSAHQPLDDLKPGLGLGVYGQWFNRHDTWAELAGPWIDYLARSSWMLRQGEHVSDILWYYGEDNNVTGLYSHSFPEIPEGYDFDFINPDALLSEISVVGGTAVTRSGKEYKVICLDRNCSRMSLKILKKISLLASRGVIICGHVPSVPASMYDSKTEFEAIIKDIWFSGRPNVFRGIWLDEVMQLSGISPDWTVQNGQGIRAVHRALPEGHLYWVNSPALEPQSVDISLRVCGLKPQKWNPMNGEVTDLSYRFEGDRTVVNLDFEPNDAFFIVLREKADEGSVTLPEEKRTALDSLEIEGMGCWTENPQTRHFSGTLSYRHTLDIPEYTGRLLIDLGEVYNLAQVFIDGKPVETLWKAPFKVDITDYIKDRKTVDLEIRVTNLWVNHLIGDAAKEPHQRSSYTSFDFYNGTEPLQKSGLIGPVILVEEQ